jgi:hypothetical protein
MWSSHLRTTDEVQLATLTYGWATGISSKVKRRGRASGSNVQSQSGGWPGFGFILSEVELRRLR